MCSIRISLFLIITIWLNACSQEIADQSTPQLAEPATLPLGKLPLAATPTAYRIHLNIDPEKNRFGGEVEIDVTLNTEVHVLYLHGVDLTMHSLWIENNGQRQTLAITSFEQLTPDGVAKLTFPHLIGPNTVTLGFSYDAPFAKDLAGVYKVVQADNSYIFTQFESIDARRAFPGFDEPRFKTTYDLSITTPKGNRVFANTPMDSEHTTEDGQITANFSTTKLLPSYLVAFAVGPLDLVNFAAIPASPFRKTPIPLRGIAVKGKGPLLDYALKETGPMVLAFEEYFGLPYPFKKLDIVAIPDFAAGAMENAGLITFRDNLLLLKDDAPSSQRRANIGVNAHELAHQWFGDLVTMPWWDDIWLNESFATWAGVRIAQSLHPEFGFTTFLQAAALRVMAGDSKQSVRRVHEPVNNSNDIANAFDGVTYQKGGAILHMFENYLGEETFQRGVHNHLDKYAFGSATAKDFFASMALAAGDEMISKGFQSFVDQKGVPLLDITIDCSVEQDAQIVVEQSRYSALGSGIDANQFWTVPFCFRYAIKGVEQTACQLLNAQSSSVPLSGCPDWVMPNKNGSGYYRWALEPKTQTALGEVFNSLPGSEQLSIADSVNAGFATGAISTPTFIASAAVLSKSETRQVVVSAMQQWRWLHHRLSPDAQANSSRQMQEIYGNRLQELDARATRNPDEETLRKALSALLARYGGDENLRRTLVKQATQFLASTPGDDIVDWERLQLALTVTIEDAGKNTRELVDSILNRFTKSDSSAVRNALLSAIGDAWSDVSLEVAQKLFFSPDIKENERLTLIFAMQNWQHREAHWQWFQDNFERIKTVMPSRAQPFMPVTGQSFCTEKNGKELRVFFQPLLESLIGVERTLNQTLEGIEMCRALAARQIPDAEAYFLEI